MFQFIAKYRRRLSTRKRRGLLDRKLSLCLGVEAMEDRMMLAATGLEYEPSGTPTIQPVAMDLDLSENYRIDFQGDLTKFLQQGDGGFIATRSLFTNAGTNLAHDFVGTAVNQVSDGTFVRNHIASPILTADQNGTIRDSIDFDGLDVYQGGLDPANILDSPSYSDYTDGDATEVNVVHNDDTPGSASEGGPISIPVILASRELVGGSQLDPTNGMKSLASLSSSAVVPSQLTSNTLALNAVSAEWARAMVLETAGGEPDVVRQFGADQHSGQSSALDSGSGQRISEPLSSDQPGGAPEKSAASATDATRAGHAATPIVLDNSLWLASATLTGFVSAVSNGDATLDLTHFAGQLVGGAGQGASESVATDAAFDKIGGDDQTLLQSLTDGGWRRPLAAAPLVMMLALERIAAGNSRRAYRDAAPGIVGRCKPRRDGQNS